MRFVHACTVLACGAVPAALSAQGPLIRLRPNAGEIGTELRGERRGYTGSSDVDDVSQRTWIRIPLSGTLLAPQIFTYDLSLRPVFGQQRTGGLERRFSTRSTGVDFNASMLQTTYTSLQLFATRATGSAEGGFGGESFFHSSGRGATVRLNTAYLPLHAEVSRRNTDDVWHASVNSTPLRRQEHLTTVRIGGSNSKTTIVYDQQRFTDRIGTLSFAAHNLALSHRARWGRGSVLESSLDRGARTGSDPFSRAIWVERVTLRHARAFTSDWYYQTRQSHTQGIASSGSALGGTMRYEVVRGLTTSLQGTRLTSSYAQGKSASFSLAPRFAWRQQLFPGGFVSSSLGFVAERVRREITDGEWLDVTEERHRMAPARVFTLDRPHVDAGSVVVRSADLVQRYEPGIDYRLVIFGPLVRVQLITGSRIAVGDVVVISYRHRLLVKTPHRVSRTSFDAALTTPHLTVTHNQNWRQLKLEAGPPSAVPPEGDDRATGINLYATVGPARASLEVEERARTKSSSDFMSRELRVGLTPGWTGRWHGSLGGALGRTQANARVMDVMSGNMSLGMSPLAALRLQVTLDAWTIQLPEAKRELYLGRSLEFDWRIGQIETEWRYWHQTRTAELTGNQQRLWLRVLRRF
ncbi:MAG: hypothetical protein AB1762_07965 [Gemmatimonadota bacterium]